MRCIQNGKNEVYCDDIFVYKFMNDDVHREIYFTDLVKSKINTWEIVKHEYDVTSPSGKHFNYCLVLKYIHGVSLIDFINDLKKLIYQKKKNNLFEKKCILSSLKF